MKSKVVMALLVIALGCASAGCAVPTESGAGARGAFVKSVIAAVSAHSVPDEPIRLADITAPEPYAYSTLDSGDRERYRILLDAFSSREAREYPDDDMDRLTRVRDCVLADHPELFAIQSVHTETTTNSLTEQVTNVTVEAEYTRTAEEADEVLRVAKAAAEECFALLAADADDYAKAKCAYEYLVACVEYDKVNAGVSPSPDQTIEGALVNRLAVCGGYAHAFAYLMQRAGVQCAVVSGFADGAEHAWCLALLDGDCYYVDPTWGDPIDGSLNYDYLAITSADMKREHEATSPFTLPTCTAVADNYYVREGLLFDWPDEMRFANLVAARSEQVRCSNWDTYTSLLDFVTSGQLARWLGVESYRYASSDELLTLKVYLS